MLKGSNLPSKSWLESVSGDGSQSGSFSPSRTIGKAFDGPGGAVTGARGVADGERVSPPASS